MHPGWISNQWTPGSENFTRNPRSPTKKKKKKLYPGARIRLADPAGQLGTQGLRWSPQLIPLPSGDYHLNDRPWELDGETWLLSVSSRKLEACGSSSWKWIPPWYQLLGKLQWRCQQENKMRKEICEGTCWEDLSTPGTHISEQAPPLPGNTNQSQVVISFLESSSTTWSMHLSASSPSPCINPRLGSTPSEVSMSLDLKQDSSMWTKSKCIQCILTAWRQRFQTGN